MGTAADEQLNWEKTKGSRPDLGITRTSTTTGTHGLTIDPELAFLEARPDAHPESPPDRCCNTTARFKHWDMSPRAMGALYTGMRCPVFTWAAEV